MSHTNLPVYYGVAMDLANTGTCDAESLASMKNTLLYERISTGKEFEINFAIIKPHPFYIVS